MSIADELKKLEDLRWNGTLTDAEFAQAKAALLAQLAPPAAEPEAPAGPLAEHLAAVRYEQELERVDREWEMEREAYLVTGKDGARHIPKVGDGLVAAVAIGVFGAFWTVMAFSITSGAPDVMPFSLTKVFFPLFGVAFTAFGLWSGIQTAQKAEAYTKAHAAYQRRRAAVKPESFR